MKYIMEQVNNISRENPSSSRGRNGPNSQREGPVGLNKDTSDRRKCPDCDGRLSKESSKSKSRVWKKVMWFTRRSKTAKNGICHCQTDEGLHSNIEDRHSNTWSFTRSSSRKFRISSRKRQCKSESSKKSFRVRGKQDETCTSQENSLPSTRTASICSSGTNSPTATGSFCDFGATSHAGGKGSRRLKNTFVLTEIAREINPPVKNDTLPLSDIQPPPKKLSKSSSSVSHLSRRCMSPVSGNFRRSKSFPGSQNCISPSKRRFINMPNTAFASLSPPVKQKCYGLRRTATFCGKLNMEFPKMCMKKSKSINTAELMKLGKSTSLGEIRDQSGSIVGVVHFYKSPKKLARRMSSFNHEVKKDCAFAEEAFPCETGDQISSNLINVSQEGSRACLNKNRTISESQRDANLLPKYSTFNETSKRDCKKTCKDEITTNSDLLLPLGRTSKQIGSVEASLSLSNINEEINEVCSSGSSQDKPILCANEPILFDNDPDISSALYTNESSQDLGLDPNDDHTNVKNVSVNNYDSNDNEADVSSVVNINDSVQQIGVNSNINTTDSLSGCICAGSLSSMTIQELTITEHVNGIEKINHEPDSLMKDERLCTNLLSKCETNNSSNLETVSELSQDDHRSDGPYHKNDLLTEQPCASVTSQSCENVELLCYPQDCISNNCNGCDHHHGNQLLTEPPSSLATSAQISEDEKLPCHCNDSVSGNCNGNCLLTKHMCVSSKSHQVSKISEEFALETGDEIVSNANEQCTNGVTKSVSNSCGIYMNEMCIDDVSFFQKSDDSFCSINAGMSEISVDDTSFPEMINNSVYTSGSGDSCLESEVEITDEIDGLMASDKRNLEFGNDVKLSHDCPCIMSESDLTSEAYTTPVVPQEKFQMRVHSSMITRSENTPNSPTSSRESANDQVKPNKESPTNVSCSQNCENVRNIAPPVMSHEEFEAFTSPQVLECSRTSDYVSMFDQSFNPSQNDVPIHTWKTSESDLKSDEIGLPVPGETFKMRTELMLSWFEEFNDEQRNIILKKILNHCELPQMHLLSVTMENNLHKTCPPNCQDMLVWLPYTVTLKILMYLDPVSLCRCSQVNRAWNELTDNTLLWQRLTRNPDYQLSEASSNRQYQKFTQANGEIYWKKVFAERFLLQRNWLNGKYKLRTFEGHNQGIACVQFDDTRIVSGSSDKTIKLWDISNTPSELMLTLEGHSGTVRCLDLNGNRLVSGSTDRTIKVWDLSFASYWAGASCKVTMVGHLHTVRCLQADEKKLVSGSYDKTVKVWDLKTGQCQLTLRGHTAAVLCVQFDDQKIVSGSYDKKIKVWDLTEGTCLMTLDGHQDAVTCLNLTHDGMKIITGSLDYSLKFWDLSTGKCYGTLDWITSEGHTAVVRCLQVDSWRIVSGGDDKTLKVWELATGQRLLTLRYHSDGVTCMQFNDFAIVSGSYDRTVKLWDFTPKHPYLEAVT